MLSITLLLSTSLAFARPLIRCDIHHARLILPSNQTKLIAPPASLPPSFIAGAIGVQNYTCDFATQTYTCVVMIGCTFISYKSHTVLSNIGAVAELFDISCLYDSPGFGTIQDNMFADWSRKPDSFTIQDLTKENEQDPAVLGQHYFISNGTATAPKWDFTSASECGNAEAYSVGAKIGDLPVPGSNVDWLSLESVEGDLADLIYRVDTRSGLPPASVSILRKWERTFTDEY